MIEVILIAFALSADAFAVSLGLAPHIRNLRATLMLVCSFAFFHAFMPAVGYLIGLGVVKWIEQYAHWFGFVLLIFIGTKMIFDSFSDMNANNKAFESKTQSKQVISYMELLSLSFITSIDALAVGSTLAILDLHPVISCLLIGVTTGAMSFIGLSIGHKSSKVFKDKAGIFGGSILIIIGFRILLT